MEENLIKQANLLIEERGLDYFINNSFLDSRRKSNYDNEYNDNEYIQFCFIYDYIKSIHRDKKLKELLDE